MRDEKNPLVIPRQHPRPNLHGRVRADFPAEGAGYAAQRGHQHGFLPARVFPFGVGGEAGAEDGVEVVAAGDVEVGEVGGVGLVQGVVDFSEGNGGGVDGVLEEGWGWAVGRGRGQRLAADEVVMSNVTVDDACLCGRGGFT